MCAYFSKVRRPTEETLLNIDPFEIKALVERLKQSNIEPHGAKLIERLLVRLRWAGLMHNRMSSQSTNGSLRSSAAVDK